MDLIPVKIMIVEDSLTQRMHLEHLLEQNNFKVSVAENGKSALRKIAIELPDLVISDIVMPEMNGFELCNQIKSEDRLSNIPVILLTSLSNPEDVLEGLACGADNFITKPFKAGTLITQIKSALANKRTHQHDRVRLGIEIDFMGKRRFVTAEQQQMLTLLLSTYEAAVLRNDELAKAQDELRIVNEQLEELVKVRTQALRQSEEKYLDLYDNAPSMFMSVEQQYGNVVDCNETLLLNTGFRKEEVIGHHFTGIYHPDCFDGLEGDFSDFMKTGKINNSERTLRTKSGGKITVLINATAVRDENGNILHSRTVLQDISDLKKIQEELRRSMEKAEESDRLKSAFLANMSHEIRTPMNGILGFSQLLKDPELDPSTRIKFIELIDNSTQRLLKIITDIVEISRIESGVDELQISEFDVTGYLSETEDFFRNQAELKKLALYVKNIIEPAFSKIITDQVKLKQIITNLVSNAIKFTDEGRIDITVWTENKTLYCSVRDTGIGVAPEMQKVIFDRFRQVEIGHSRKYGGTGLGLSIAKSYAELLRGDIQVESVIGSGSKFTLALPVEYLQASDAVSRPSTSVSHTGNPDWKGKQILVAEDEDENALFISIALTATGINIIRAKNGEEAVDRCRENPSVALVLMDIRMPKMDGFTATKNILSFRSDIPVIATTAYAFSSDRQKCHEAGCAEFLAKPFRKEELIKILKKYLG